MAEDPKDKQPTTAKKATTAKTDKAAPTAQEDRAQLDATAEAVRDRGGRAVKVEVDPAEAQENHADWLDGRDPNDVVEVDGQRETAEARMARNGISSPEKAAGATTL